MQNLTMRLIFVRQIIDHSFCLLENNELECRDENTFFSYLVPEVHVSHRHILIDSDKRPNSA